MLKIMADNGVEISAKQDGALYNVALNDQDFIIQGLGDEFAMSHTGLVVTVESGEAIVHGRHITADTSNQISLPQNESGYLVLRVDLTKPIGQEALLFATPTLTHEEINWDGTIYDMAIATFTTTTIDISNFEDVRVIRNTATPPLELKTIGGESLIGDGNIPLKTIDGNSIIGSGNIKSVFYGIDTSRILFNGSLPDGDSYIAIEDCVIFMWSSWSSQTQMQIDGVGLDYRQNYANQSRSIFLKKGQVFKNTNGNIYTHYFKVFGVK